MNGTGSGGGQGGFGYGNQGGQFGGGKGGAYDGPAPDGAGLPGTPLPADPKKIPAGDYGGIATTPGRIPLAKPSESSLAMIRQSQQRQYKRIAMLEGNDDAKRADNGEGSGDVAAGFALPVTGLVWAPRDTWTRRQLDRVFLGEVVPENLFFVFGERTEALHSFLVSFCDHFSIPHPPDDFYGPIYIYTKQDARSDKGKPNPRAVILCKLVHAEVLKKRLRHKQEDPSDDSDCYQVTRSELQELKGELCKVSSHDGKDSLLLQQNKEKLIAIAPPVKWKPH